MSFFVENIPPRRERGKPHRLLVDEEAISAHYAPPPQGDPPIPSKFLLLPIHQVGPFPPMSPKAFQAFTAYWHAQTEAQAQAGQG